MEFTEFIKKNLVMIITLVMTLILTVVLGLLMKSSYTKLKEFRDKVKEMGQKERIFRQVDYRLDNTNLQTAQENAKKAANAFDLLLTDISRQFTVPTYGSDLSPIKAKELIIAKRDLFKRQLESSGVQTTIADFTFGTYISQGTLPNPVDIPMIRKNLDIVEELVQRVAGADLKSLDRIGRVNRGLHPQARDLYGYIRYDVNVTGNVVQVQRFINSLNNSRLCFIVQKVTVNGADLTTQLRYPTAAADTTAPAGTAPQPGMDMPPGMPPDMPPDMMPGAAMPPPPVNPTFPNRRTAGTPGQPTATAAAPAAPPQILPIEDRIAFTELASLNVSLIVDYVEFQKPATPASSGE